MKQWIKDLFSEQSAVSAMRVMCMLCVLTACGLAIYATVKQQSEIAVIVALLSAGITGKVSQKAMESKDESGK